MKKMVVTIIILSIIFVSMLVNRYSTVRAKDKVNVDEVQKIQEYVDKIYLWKEVTGDCLPCFDSIDKVNKKWSLEVLNKNIESSDITFDVILNKGKEIFGNEFNINNKNDLEMAFDFDSKLDKYYSVPFEVDNNDDCFLLANIDKEADNYIVYIYEYQVDYSLGDKAIVKNLKGEEIGSVTNFLNKGEINDIVKSNPTRFDKKKLTIKIGDNLNIKKVEKCGE